MNAFGESVEVGLITVQYAATRLQSRHQLAGQIGHGWRVYKE